jgi:hypothetical protein
MAAAWSSGKAGYTSFVAKILDTNRFADFLLCIFDFLFDVSSNPATRLKPHCTAEECTSKTVY